MVAIQSDAPWLGTTSKCWFLTYLQISVNDLITNSMYEKTHVSLCCSCFISCCDDSVLMVWFSLGTKTTCAGLGEAPVLAQNRRCCQHKLKFQRKMFPTMWLKSLKIRSALGPPQATTLKCCLHINELLVLIQVHLIIIMMIDRLLAEWIHFIFWAHSPDYHSAERLLFYIQVNRIDLSHLAPGQGVLVPTKA